MSDLFAWPSPTQTSPLKDCFPAVGFVPCPGEPHAAGHVAGIVQRTAKALTEISDVLHGTGEGDWKGRHAEAFREQFDDDFLPKVDKAKRSFGKAATALKDWADAMPEWQRDAEVLETQAQDAQDALHAAKKKLAGLPPRPPLGLPPADDAEARKQERAEKDRSAAELAASTAESDLDRIRAQARKLADDYDVDGRAVARRLDKAMNIAPNEPGPLHRLGDALLDIGKALNGLDEIVAQAVDAVVADAVKWLAEHANSIAALGDSVVSNRTLAQDALGVLPFGGAFRGVSRVVAASRAADAAANFGLVDTVAAFIADPTALGYFAPKNDRQTIEAALPGGDLLVAFENA
ncbi:hypothetical protein [Streptomyces sp. NPDC127038]|uniref:hypothetical protein n=1 Tax=Streptomyces sp. NPDC127038 TaxID=3347114 RepID=UPI003658136B